MSEEKKSRFGFYLFRPKEKKVRAETQEEEGIASMMDRTFVKEVTIESFKALATSLEEDGAPKEVVEGALAMLIFDVQASRFSGNVGDRQPITPYELQKKAEAIKTYKEYRDYLGPDHEYTQKWLTACQIILHNHFTRGTSAADLKFRPVVPWNIVPAKGSFGQATPKKDSLEAD